jgi:hypothetical protein
MMRVPRFEQETLYGPRRLKPISLASPEVLFYCNNATKTQTIKMLPRIEA